MSGFKKFFRKDYLYLKAIAAYDKVTEIDQKIGDENKLRIWGGLLTLYSINTAADIANGKLSDSVFDLGFGLLGAHRFTAYSFKVLRRKG